MMGCEKSTEKKKKKKTVANISNQSIVNKGNNFKKKIKWI
jgi:hypothetical protein